MAESAIVQKILDSAEARGGKLIDDARARHDAALRQALGKLSAEMEEKETSARKRETEAQSQQVSSFRLVEKNRTLALKRSLLDGVIEEAWKKLLEPARYRKWIEAQMNANCMKGDSLIVPAGQEALFSGELQALLSRHGVTVAGTRGSIRGGFIIQRGSMRLNCTLDEAVKNAAREGEVEISRILFG